MALLDGDLMPAQFQLDRISNADLQGLLKMVSVRPNQEYTEEYPEEIKGAVRSLENIQVKDLVELLGRVKAAAWSERDTSGKAEEEVPCPACPVGW